MDGDKGVAEVKIKQATVLIFPSLAEMASTAASRAAESLRGAIAERGRARIIVATGNSQIAFLKTLTEQPGIDWSKVEVFHMDEYVGMDFEHPAGFRRYVKTRLVDVVGAGRAHYLNGEALDLDVECRRYGELLAEAPIDLCCMGIGENGHIAFNDPHVADFKDPLAVKRVTLDEACRRQQVGEGHFTDLDATPREALTLTCPVLITPRHLICIAPERRKAEAARNAIEGPLSEDCPASLLLTQPHAAIYLDQESASLLSVNQ